MCNLSQTIYYLSMSDVLTTDVGSEGTTGGGFVKSVDCSLAVVPFVTCGSVCVFLSLSLGIQDQSTVCSIGWLLAWLLTAWSSCSSAHHWAEINSNVRLIMPAPSLLLPSLHFSTGPLSPAVSPVTHCVPCHALCPLSPTLPAHTIKAAPD
jgi:hypothetical protein